MTALEVAAAEDVGLSSERIGLARRLLHEHVDTGRTPAAAALVTRRGIPVMAEVAGEQRPGGPPLALDHVWPLASASKPFTAAVLLSLAEEGLVGVLQPIVDYLPELADTGNDDVLIHHLLTHTAGWESPLFSGRALEMFVSGELGEPPPGRQLWTHLFLTIAADPVRVGAPGELMAYANINYELLAEIVRRVTGGTFEAAIRSRMFEPLGMTRSATVVGDDLRPELVQRAPELPFGSPESPPGGFAFQGPDFEAGDNGFSAVKASPGDLAAFGQMILDEGSVGGTRVLAPSTVRSMTTNQIPGTPALFAKDTVISEGSWGYGFSVICEQRWPYFGGGLVPLGSVTHPGAGGINYWIDIEHEIVGVFFEVLSEMSPDFEPISGLSHRFQDVITAAVIA